MRDGQRRRTHHRRWPAAGRRAAAVNNSSKAMPHSSIRLDNRPTERRDACSVRAAMAVPTWQATIAAKVAVVACR